MPQFVVFFMDTRPGLSARLQWEHLVSSNGASLHVLGAVSRSLTKIIALFWM